MWEWIAGAFGKVFEPINTIVSGWQQRQTARTEAEVSVAKARAEAEVARLNAMAKAEIDWDYEALRQAQSSWKDEYWTVLLSVPLILAFVPGMNGYVMAGFKNLESVPEWYITAVGGLIAMSIGFRGIIPRFFKGKK